MVHFLWLLAGTMWLRPYVFIFLGAYLLIAVWHLGPAGPGLPGSGYLISWAAEFASIHWGFPFGEYLYIPATLDQELWVAGVPFMDSLSYVFLAYASYSLALLALTQAAGGETVFSGGEAAIKGAWRPVVLGAVLMVTLDIVIDPWLSGVRWFLGQSMVILNPGSISGHLEQLRRLVPGVLRTHRGLAAYHYPGARVPRLGLGRRRFPFQALLGPVFTWPSWAST